jgi:ribonuclease PH
MPFSREEMQQLLGLAEQGVRQLIAQQKQALADIITVVKR